MHMRPRSTVPTLPPGPRTGLESVSQVVVDKIVGVPRAATVLGAAAGLLLAGATLDAGAAPAATRPPNVVLIYADDLGYGDTGAYGATAVKTPHIDRLAAEGLRFTDAYATSAICTPSRFSLLTGRYAWREPGRGVLPGDAPMMIRPATVTVASLLKQAGYATAVVGKWHLGLGDGRPDWNGTIRPGPETLGFDHHFLIPATVDRVPCVFVEDGRVVGLDPADPIEVSYERPFPGLPLGRTHPELLTTLRATHGHDMAIVNGIGRIGYMRGGRAALWKDEDIADTLVRQATSWIAAHRDGPFFLYLATHDVHEPRVPHPRFRGRSPLGSRGDVIEELDWQAGAVLEALEKHGLADRTLVILSSDNGPIEDDGYEQVTPLTDRRGHRPGGPFRGAKYSILEAGTRVPLLVRWPGRVKPGVSPALVSQVDLAASLAALAGVAVPDGAAGDSVNVLPALLGDRTTARDHVVIQGTRGLALREGRWKLIPPGHGEIKDGLDAIHQTREEAGPTGLLFDLAADPEERTDLAAREPARVAALSKKLEQVRTAPAAPGR
jgi:arylsulfatase A-like enzyme